MSTGYIFNKNRREGGKERRERERESSRGFKQLVSPPIPTTHIKHQKWS